MALRTVGAGAALLTTALLTACTTTTATTMEVSSGPGPAATATSGVRARVLGPVRDLDGLRDAAVGAGYTCASWDRTDDLDEAAASGSCSDDDSFSTYVSAVDRDAVVALRLTTDDPSALVGPNWIISGVPAGGSLEVGLVVQGLRNGEVVRGLRITDGRSASLPAAQGRVPGPGARLTALVTEVTFAPP